MVFYTYSMCFYKTLICLNLTPCEYDIVNKIVFFYNLEIEWRNVRTFDVKFLNFVKSRKIRLGFCAYCVLHVSNRLQKTKMQMLLASIPSNSTRKNALLSKHLGIMYCKIFEQKKNYNQFVLFFINI